MVPDVSTVLMVLWRPLLIRRFARLEFAHLAYWMARFVNPLPTAIPCNLNGSVTTYCAHVLPKKVQHSRVLLLPIKTFCQNVSHPRLVDCQEELKS